MRAERPAGFLAYSKKVFRNNSTPKFVMADPKKSSVCVPICICSGKRENRGGEKNGKQIFEKLSDKKWKEVKRTHEN
jgi:hypothetical protein